jgi:hypothetical protein
LFFQFGGPTLEDVGFTTTTFGALFFAAAAPTRNPHPNTTKMCDNDARHGAKKAATEEKVIHKQMRRHIMPRMAQQQQQQVNTTTPTTIPAVGSIGAVPLIGRTLQKELGVGRVRNADSCCVSLFWTPSFKQTFFVVVE